MVKIGFNKKGIKLYNADCFKIFPKIKDKTIDLFVLDLPFGITACPWDTCIDLEKMWIEIKRIMKPNAVLCFFCNTKFGYSLIKSNEKWFKYDLIWQKSRKVGFLSANKRQLRNHENIYVFKDNQGTYHPQKTQGHKPYTHGKRPQKSAIYGAPLTETTKNKDDGTRHPTSIIEHENIYVFKDKQGTYNPQKTELDKVDKRNRQKDKEQNIVYGENVKLPTESTYKHRHPTSIIEHENTILKYNNPHKTIHRTEKPIGLLEYLIKTYSNEGDIVMDFTAGSMSCGEACYNTKRNFLGVEMNKDIYELGLNRIKNLFKKEISKN